MQIHISTYVITISIAIVTFILQKTFSNIIAGSILRCSKPFKKHDRISISQNSTVIASGCVINVGLFSTNIKTYEKNIIHLPNAKVLDDYIVINASEKPEYNYTETIYIDVNSDFMKAREIIKDILCKNERTVNNIVNTNVNLKYIQQKLAMTYNVRTSITIDESFSVCNEILTAILIEFKTEGIKLA